MEKPAMTSYESMMERRRHPRTRLSVSANCIRLDPDGGDVTDRIDVIDISRSGLGAVSARPFYPGQRLVVSLPRWHCGGQRSVYASIVRCRQQTEGYRIGLEFDPMAIGTWADSQVEFAAA